MTFTSYGTAATKLLKQQQLSEPPISIFIDMLFGNMGCK